MKNLHLICNAHLDPVWMWEKDEGIAEVLSTYRVAADFCENYPDFIFNHNESVLYEWVEEYDKELFQKIQKLVKDGRWNIMGGFYLQPDCNMPSGEAMMRQGLVGRKYFKDKFDSIPTTAINFDSFGHSQGLVQILHKLGYESYIVCRPVQDHCELPAEDFKWIGYDGSEIFCHRGFNSYESHRGKADMKIADYLDMYPDNEIGLVLWGIGNHGGGPSRVDYERISTLSEKKKDDWKFIHSTPENYFKDFETTEGTKGLPIVDKPLQYHSVGCYTSQIRVKQRYRQLENMLFKVEKMVSAATLNGLMEYPRAEFEEAEKDMLFNQFHDILPGSSIEVAEEAALRQIDHGIEILERLKIKSFLLMLQGEKRAEDGEIPIFVYNPHPVEVDAIVECEFNLPDQNIDRTKWCFPRVYRNGEPIECQVEHEQSNFNVDWRKKVVFRTKLEASSINAFICKVEMWDEEPKKELTSNEDKIYFDTEEINVVINCKTGGIDSYKVKGIEYIKENTCIPGVFEDDYDSWGNTAREYRNRVGNFALMSPEEGTDFSGITAGKVESVRVIEDGEVRSVVEAVMKFKRSTLCIRYYLPKKGSEIQIDIQVNFQENMKILKLPFITNLKDSKYIGQVMYGRQELINDGMEVVAQKFTAVVSEKEDKVVTIINNGTYGSDCCDGEARISLLRTPGYSAGCSDFSRRKPEVMEQERHNVFMDQGKRSFSFWLNAGTVKERLENVEMEATLHNETVFALSCFPSGEEKTVKPLIKIDNPVIQITSCRKAMCKDTYILRVFEPTGKKQKGMIQVFGTEHAIELKGHEIQTWEYDPAKRTLMLVEALDELMF